MAKRLSIVDTINIKSDASSSVIQVGDSVTLSPRSKALAAQKQYPLYQGSEGSFAPFHAFSQEIPKVQPRCNVNMTTHNEVPVIKVNSVHILGVAASSMLHVGSTQYIDSESRVQHFRHFFFPPESS